MSNAIYLGVHGGNTALRALDVAANNLANSQTTGFKADRPVFEVAAVGPTEAGEQEMLTARSVVDMSAGTSRITDEPLDLALDGAGFFQLEGPDGPLLTRAGMFSLNAEGEIVSRDGLALLSVAGGAINGAGGEIVIDDDGTVRVEGEARGRINVVDADPETLEKRGGTRFVTDAELLESDARIAQGRLEGSNVDPVGSLVELIALQRYYEAFQQTAKAADGMDQQLATRVGRKTD